jgi:SPP1 gp7 family putative phage head morphogenesis protein
VAKFTGPSRTDIERRHDRADLEVRSALRVTMRRVADDLSGVVTVDDLGTLTRHWTEQVNTRIMPLVTEAYWAGVDFAYVGLADALPQHLTAGPGDDLDPELTTDPALTANQDAANPTLATPFEIPRISSAVAEQQLAVAQNRLVNVANSIWELARGELLQGMQAGESIRELQSRLTDSTTFSNTRAELIARSEIGNAANTGARQQVATYGLPTKKEWISTNDGRTRPTHRAMDGVKVALDGTFPIGFDPGDDYNCRCSTGFHIDDDDVEQYAETLTSATDAEALNERQYQVLSPTRKNSASTIVKELQTTRAGRNVYDMIKSFTEKRGGVANLRKSIDKVLHGDDASPALRQKIKDFIGALNGFPRDDVPTLYRGIAVKVEQNTHAWWNEFESRYAIGTKFDMNVSSFSSSERKAREFMSSINGTRSARGCLQMKIVVDGPVHALPVERLSKFQSEKEWFAGGQFEVTQFSPPDGKRLYYEVHVRQLKSLEAPP